MNTEELIKALRRFSPKDLPISTINEAADTIERQAKEIKMAWDSANQMCTKRDALAEENKRQAEAIRVLREALALLVGNAKHGDFVSETRIETAEHALAQTKEFGE